MPALPHSCTHTINVAELDVDNAKRDVHVISDTLPDAQDRSAKDKRCCPRRLVAIELCAGSGGLTALVDALANLTGQLTGIETKCP